ncbi:MAG TPA: GAF domain-containing sensor histidine kinase [Actinomycetota bacterium]|nr:GAF domain-containing sensor histidine kinase [Actinomycetota bacterium]
MDDRSERLIRAGLVLASDLSLETVLQRIVDEAVDLTDATYGALGVLGADGRIAEFVTTGITAEQRAAIGDPPTGHGILGLLIRDPRPVRIPNLADHEFSYGFPPNHPHMTSFLGAPVTSRGRVFGNLYLTNKKGAAEFDQRDEDALVVLAAQAGIAVENARLYAEARSLREEVRRLAVLEDRERIAKDLHDGVIQSLFAVGMGLQGTSMASGDPLVAERIDAAVEEIDRVIRDLRNYIFGLRPGALADRALDAALRELVAEFEQRSEVVTVAEIDPAVAAGLSSVAAEVLQLAREALSNVGRHSGAATCRLSLTRTEDRAVLEIDDDGVGFDASSVPRGDGLTNLEQRAQSAGGRTLIESAPGRGTTVRVELPL